MAAFVFKRIGYGSGIRGRRGIIPDAAMASVLSAYKTLYGTPAMTDDEVTDKMFDDLIQQLAEKANAQARLSAAKTASDAVTPIAPTVASDNT